jgi:hypothetical protein
MLSLALFQTDLLILNIKCNCHSSVIRNQCALIMLEFLLSFFLILKLDMNFIFLCVNLLK